MSIVSKIVAVVIFILGVSLIVVGAKGVIDDANELTQLRQTVKEQQQKIESLERENALLKEVIGK